MYRKREAIIFESNLHFTRREGDKIQKQNCYVLRKKIQKEKKHSSTCFSFQLLLKREKKIKKKIIPVIHYTQYKYLYRAIVLK